MLKYSIIVLFFTLALIALAGVAIAQSGEKSLEATSYARPIQPAFVSCGPWGPWISSSTYCYGDTPMCFFYTGGRRLEDLYRERQCTNSTTGLTYTDREFKTAGAGCCGDPIIPPGLSDPNVE